MERSSIQALIASEKGRRALLILNEGPRDLSQLAVSLETTQKELFSIIRQLEEQHLIYGEDGVYMITHIGKSIPGKPKSLLSTESAADTVEGYWQKHNMDFIPPSLLKELHKLNSCVLVQPRFPDVFDYNREVHEISKSSTRVCVVAACLHPLFPELFSDLLQRKVCLSLILDSCLFDKIKRDKYDDLQNLVKSRQVELYLCSKSLPFVSFKVNDACLELKLLTDEDTYDHKRLVCHGMDSVDWGKELFEHYRQQSVKVNDI